ncbi:glutathione peroxidase [Hydrogenophaga sp.]|jgi:glutathione peroxidase|uniref:glutathione peroxidase n=1 Tax=Hydrogenophaga sp. TaxID=1904254 RepID=UPI003F70D438
MQVFQNCSHFKRHSKICLKIIALRRGMGCEAGSLAPPVQRTATAGGRCDENMRPSLTAGRRDMVSFRNSDLNPAMRCLRIPFQQGAVFMNAKFFPWRALVVAWVCLGATGAAVASEATCPNLLQHRFDRLQDEKPQSLCQYSGRVVLVVNTASFCGFTSQYEGLEALNAKYQARGLVVLGFPSNDFGRQEPGSNQAIAEFCENTFGVKFPMFSKTSVVGPGTNPLYQQLAERTGERPQWNFHKYLIARDGKTVRSYGSRVEPKDPGLLKDIEKFLSTK